FDPEPASWERREWIDYATRQTHPITVDLTAPSATHRPPGWKRPVVVVGWDEVWRQYWSKAIPTTRDADGRVCTGEALGLLTPRTIRPSRLLYLGKESVEIARAEADLPTDETLTYGTGETAQEWEQVRRSLDDAAWDC